MRWLRVSRFFLVISILMCLSTNVHADTAADLKEWQKKYDEAKSNYEKAKAAGKNEDELRKHILEMEAASGAITRAKEILDRELEAQRKALGLPAKGPIGTACYQSRPRVGDLSYIGLDNWSVGTSVSAQLVKYNFSSKRAALNTGLGAGVAFRYYGDTNIGDAKTVKDDGWPDAVKQIPTDDKGHIKVPLYMIAPECRATTTDVGQSNKLASSIFSIIPTVYAVKPENGDDLSLQPAILLGVLNDIVNIGAGFNLTGSDKGKVFLLFSLGYGFKF